MRYEKTQKKSWTLTEILHLDNMSETYLKYFFTMAHLAGLPRWKISFPRGREGGYGFRQSHVRFTPGITLGQGCHAFPKRSRLRETFATTQRDLLVNIHVL